MLNFLSIFSCIFMKLLKTGWVRFPLLAKIKRKSNIILSTRKSQTNAFWKGQKGYSFSAGCYVKRWRWKLLPLRWNKQLVSVSVPTTPTFTYLVVSFDCFGFNLLQSGENLVIESIYTGPYVKDPTEISHIRSSHIYYRKLEYKSGICIYCQSCCSGKRIDAFLWLIRTQYLRSSLSSFTGLRRIFPLMDSQIGFESASDDEIHSVVCCFGVFFFLPYSQERSACLGTPSDGKP